MSTSALQFLCELKLRVKWHLILIKGANLVYFLDFYKASLLITDL